MPVLSLRTLLTGRIDYAGRFPPAALSMAGAVANHEAYLPAVFGSCSFRKSIDDLSALHVL